MIIYPEYLSPELRKKVLYFACEEFRKDSIGVVRSADGLAWHSRNIIDSEISKDISFKLGVSFTESWIMIYGPGGCTKKHYHHGVEMSIAITVYGTGKLEVLDEILTVRPGDMVTLLNHEKHRALPSSTSRVVFVANLGNLK